MEILMYLVCAMVFLAIAYFLVMFTGEITRWFVNRIGDSYRNNRQPAEAMMLRTTISPKA
jgi:hypothetical protein